MSDARRQLEQARGDVREALYTVELFSPTARRCYEARETIRRRTQRLAALLEAAPDVVEEARGTPFRPLINAIARFDAAVAERGGAAAKHKPKNTSWATPSRTGNVTANPAGRGGESPQ